MRAEFQPWSVATWTMATRPPRCFTSISRAALIGARQNEIVFTSGGTEANNLAIRGLCETSVAHGRHIITSAIEHPSVAGVCLELEKRGWEVTRLLKANQSTRHIPIIALTAHAMVSDREKAIDAGCDDYDTKPIELPRLLGKIEAWLSGSGTRPAGV